MAVGVASGAVGVTAARVLVGTVVGVPVKAGVLAVVGAGVGVVIVDVGDGTGVDTFGLGGDAAVDADGEVTAWEAVPAQPTSKSTSASHTPWLKTDRVIR